MELNHSISLPHLTKEVLTGARKTKLCAYAVALEGWRRGLTLKWYSKDSDKFDHMITFGTNPPGRLFSLSSKERTHYFFRTRGDKVSKEAVIIGSDKEDTKTYLTKAGVSTPVGKKFTGDVADEAIIQACEEMVFPLVLKPTNGSMGNGVITNIMNLDDLSEGLVYVRQELGYPDVIIERFATGHEYRVYVIEDQVIGAYNRIPANVVGDGVHTIKELIKLKNDFRKKNARLYDCLIHNNKETRDFIGKNGYSMNSVLEKGKQLLLQEKTNVSAGGDPIDATDELPKEIKQLAIDAVKAIPGLHHGGVDIIWDKEKPIDHAAVVIEINPTAQIGGILFPLQGTPRDIPAAIIDHYFPETKDMVTDRKKIYFDFNRVLEPLQNRTALEVEVAPAPLGEIFTKRFVLSEASNSLKFQKRIRIEALDRKINGHMTNLGDNEMEVVVAGTDAEALNDFKQILMNILSIDAANIREEEWNLPVKVGFDIDEENEVSDLMSIDTSVKILQKEIKQLEKQRRRLVYDNIKLHQSSSWRYTAGIRKLGGILKNKKSEPVQN